MIKQNHILFFDFFPVNQAFSPPAHYIHYINITVFVKEKIKEKHELEERKTKKTTQKRGQ